MVSVACVHEGKKRVYKILIRNPEGWTPIGKRRRRCEVNITMDLKAVV